MTAAVPDIDAHLHLWDLGRGGYPWITPALGPLHTDITAERARTELDGCGVRRAVLVQADDTEADTQFMIDVAREHDWVAGVVGWVQLDDPATAERQLARWRSTGLVCGIRHLVHDDPRDDFLGCPRCGRSLRQLAEAGLPFDVPDAWPRHLAATAELAAALPELTVVVDHLGKPPPAGPDQDAWREVLAAVADRPNTVAKVSGLQAPGQPFTVDGAAPGLGGGARAVRAAAVDLGQRLADDPAHRGLRGHLAGHVGADRRADPGRTAICCWAARPVASTGLTPTRRPEPRCPC